MIKLHLDQRFRRFLIMNLIMAVFHRRKEKISTGGPFLIEAFAIGINLYPIF